MVEETQFTLKSNLRLSRDAQRVGKKPCAHQTQGRGQRPPQETEPDLTLSV